MMRKLIAAGAALALAGPLTVVSPAIAQVAAAQATDAVMAEVLAHPRRDEDRARDQYRRPGETLAFFEVKPGMTVVDYMPGGGWYTRILVPYLGAEGRMIALAPPADQTMAQFAAIDTSFPPSAARWTGPGGATVLAANTDSLPADWAETADRVLIFRAMHGLKNWGIAEQELRRMHGLLKPGGMLGIVQHRARADAPDAMADGSKGYLKEAEVVAMAEAAGFELAARSEINANPKDSADWENGVWSLSPGGQPAEADKARAADVGESDRMTLLFRKKPA